eukprot:m.467712 g.467712  ORF g.467712 m.467712 type:complete len:137 (-) comp26742_c0_seq1:3785-4195(-)
MTRMLNLLENEECIVQRKFYCSPTRCSLYSFRTLHHGGVAHLSWSDLNLESNLTATMKKSRDPLVKQTAVIKKEIDNNQSVRRCGRCSRLCTNSQLIRTERVKFYSQAVLGTSSNSTDVDDTKGARGAETKPQRLK